MLQPANTLIDALSDDEIVYANPLATVTRNWIVIPQSSGHSHTLLALARVTEVRAVKISYPGLLVVASGLFVLAAAALSSKQGGGAGIPIALVGAVSAIAYKLTHRAWVAFIIGSSVAETGPGSHEQADELAAEVQFAQADLYRAAQAKSELAS